jgi:hypothetical protein
MRRLRCLWRQHKWQTRHDDDGEPYLICSRCDRRGPNPMDRTSNPGTDNALWLLGLAKFGGF